MIIKKVNELYFLGCWKRRRFALLLLFFVVYYDVGDINDLCRMASTGSFQNQNFLMFQALHKVNLCFVFVLAIMVFIYDCACSFLFLFNFTFFFQCQVMQDDSITMEKDTKANSYYHSNQSSVHDGYMKRPTPTREERNIIDEPFKPSESNHKYSNNNNNNNSRFYERPPIPLHLDALKTRAEYAHSSFDKRRNLEPHCYESSRHANITREQSPHRYDPHYQTRDGMSRLSEPPHLRIEHSDSLSGPTGTLSPNRKRPRPGPIIIPPAVNNRAIPTTISPSRHFSSFPKGIYTPPAMLSPRSIFFNPPFAPRNSMNPPQTASRIQLVKRRSCMFVCFPSFFHFS